MEYYFWYLVYAELLHVFIRLSFMESNTLSPRKCSSEFNKHVRIAENQKDHAMNTDKGQMQNLILMGALYCIGVVFFITRFPESYWPGKFNLIFQSHQIFHVLVVCAALVQVFAITVLQKNRLIEGDTCPAETQSPAASINTTQSSI